VVRLRFLRLLIPGLLILLGFAVYLSWVPRSSVHSRGQGESDEETPRAAGLTFDEWDGERRTAAGDVEHFEQRPDGRLHLEGIRNLEIHRPDRGPLVVSAQRADRDDANGRRVWRFEDEVVASESDRQLELRLPNLEVDELAGEARSSGDVRFSTTGLRGQARGLVYGLRGQPGSLDRPELFDERGGSLRAATAQLLDGLRDIELSGDVHVVQGEERLDAGRVRIWRSADSQLERIVASDGVWGSWPVGSGAPANLRGDSLDARWDTEERLALLRLSGGAVLRRGVESIAADRIEARRPAADPQGWSVEAEAKVFVQGLFDGAPGLLRADRLEARLDPALGLRTAEAHGAVTFEGTLTRAEAGWASFTARPAAPAEIRLHAADARTARLSHGRTRIAAQRIVTDARGKRLVAEERVEASLLPGPSAEPGGRSLRLFVAGEAVHFVSSRLQSDDGGNRLEFSGSVRGWQGERNLAADRLIVDSTTSSLEATGNVATRIPREPDALAVSEDDYVQIGARELRYDDRAGLARYTGEVRVQLAEGWLEAARVEVELGSGSRRIREVRAAGDVRLEFERNAEGELAEPLSGNADRVVYDPARAAVRLFGDRAPASVRRIGSGGGTTSGRVLAYHLDTGTLDVDAGAQAPARIRTAGERGPNG
jgi:lipopolysaccharide transport protein LptA